MSKSLSLTLREQDEPARLVAEGEIDINSEIEFRKALSHAAKRHDRLVVDLTAVDFLGGAAIQVLDAHSDHITALLVTMHSPHTRALSHAGLDALLAYQPRTTARG